MMFFCVIVWYYVVKGTIGKVLSPSTAHGNVYKTYYIYMHLERL